MFLRFRILFLHALLVAVLLLFWWNLPEEAGNLHLSVVVPGFPLLALGLPWSLPFLWGSFAYDSAGDTVREMVMFAPAVLNVAIYGSVCVWAYVRSIRAAES